MNCSVHVLDSSMIQSNAENRLNQALENKGFLEEENYIEVFAKIENLENSNCKIEFRTMNKRFRFTSRMRVNIKSRLKIWRVRMLI